MSEKDSDSKSDEPHALLAHQCAGSAGIAVGKPDLVLHILPALKHVVTRSPFCLKLMTYARMAGIQYDVVTSCNRPSSKGKYPWMVHNGKVVEDSAFCIEYMNDAFHVDMDSGLTDEQKGFAQAAIRLCEENLFHVLIWEQAVADNSAYAKKNFKLTSIGVVNSMAIWGFRKHISSRLQAHGIGRHTEQEIRRIGYLDIQALSRMLGDKSFLFGEMPTRADASIFGLLAHFVYEPEPTPQKEVIQKEFKNLEAYCDRMKLKYWPDWEEICSTASCSRDEQQCKKTDE